MSVLWWVSNETYDAAMGPDADSHPDRAFNDELGIPLTQLTEATLNAQDAYQRAPHRDKSIVFAHYTSTNLSIACAITNCSGFSAMMSCFCFSSSTSHAAHKNRPLTKSASGLHSQTAKCAGRVARELVRIYLQS